MAKSSGQKAATTRKRRLAAREAVMTRKRRAAGRKAGITRKRRVAGRKAATTRKLRTSSSAENTRRWYKEVWVPGGEFTVHELMAADVVGYMEGADIRSREEFLTERRRLLEAFPDLAIVADDVIADGGKVAVRWHVNATHEGDALGFPPSNRHVSFRGITWLEFKDGLIVRGWDSWNLGGLLQSLSLSK